MSYIAIGLNKSGCQFGTPSCIGIISSSFGRSIAGSFNFPILQAILKPLPIPTDVHNFLMRQDFFQNLYSTMGITIPNLTPLQSIALHASGNI